MTGAAESAGGLPPGLRRRLRRGGRFALGLAVVLAVFLAGGTRLEVRLGVAALALLALLGHALGALRRGLRWPAALWPFAALTALIGLQCLPLPAGLIETLSPEAAAVRARVLGDLGAWPAAAPLSLDPTATLRALFDQLAFLAVLVVALNLDRERRRPFAALLALVGVGVALVGAAHWALALPRLYGLYTPLHAAGLQGFGAPFINPNHAAGLLVLTTGAALGLLAHAEDARAARLGLAGLAAGLLGLPLTGSRGGLGALLVLLVAFAVQAWTRPPGGHLETPRRRARAVARVTLGLGALAAAAGAVALLRAGEAPAGGADELRFRLWRGALHQAQAFGLTGAGRGAFLATHPRYQSLAVEGTVTHPENHLLQLAVEVGLPGLLLGLGGGLWLWARARRAVGRQADPLHWGLVAGLTGFAVQQGVDFGLEVPGVALPAALALGLAAGRAPTSRPPRPLIAPVLAGLTLAALAGLALSAPGLRAHAPRAEVAALAQAEGAEALRRAGAAALTRHPADYLVALTVGGRLAEDPAVPLPEVLGWLNKALVLGPTDPRAHLLAARRLAREGREAQAAGEYRRALTVAPWQRSRWVPEVARALGDPRHLAAAVPDGPIMTTTLAEAVLALDPARAEATVGALIQAAEIRAALADRAPPPPVPGWLQVRARACLTLGRLECAAADIEALARGGAEAAAWALRARLALARNDPAAARAALDAGEEAGVADPGYLRAAAVVRLQLGDVEAARRAADRLWRKVGHDPRQGAATLALQARIEARAGEPLASLRAWQRAVAADPTPENLRAAALQAEAAGRPTEARRLMGEGLARRPQDPELLALRARLDGAEVPAPPRPEARNPPAPSPQAPGPLAPTGPDLGAPTP